MGDTEKKAVDDSLAAIVKGTKQRVVIWILMVALISTISFIGKGMMSRLSDLEAAYKSQNGDIHHIKESLIKLETNVDWIRLNATR